MRVQTIHMANLCVESGITIDAEGEMVWVVRVTERGPEHRLVFEKSGNCGHVPTGDGLDIAACHAVEVAARLASPAGEHPATDTRRNNSAPSLAPHDEPRQGTRR